jgi:hypothetical protein
MRISVTPQLQRNPLSSSQTHPMVSLATSSAPELTDYTMPQAPSVNLNDKDALDSLVKELQLEETGPHDLSSLLSTTVSAQSLHQEEKEMSALPARPVPQDLEQLLSQSAPKPKRGRLGAPRHPRNGQFLKTTKPPPTTLSVASIPTPITCTAQPDCPISSSSLIPVTYVNFAPALISSLPNRSNNEKVENLFLSPEELASEVFAFIMSSSGHTASEVEVRVREANFNKHYKPYLVTHINSILSNMPPDANTHTYKTHDSIIVECLHILGF